MRRIFIISLLIISALQSGIAQTVEGIIQDAETNKPLPFVNIGIPGKGIGTVAQGDGRFTLDLRGALPEDTIRISMIGYATEQRKAGDWMQSKQIIIALYPLDQQLAEVVVRPRDLKNVRLGNDYNSLAVQIGFVGDKEDTTDHNPPGAELGTIMKVRDGKMHYLDSCGINLANFTPDSAVIRINFYEVHNDEPDIILNREPIYATIYKGQRTLSIDLRPYDITADDDFVMAVEWLIDLKGKEEKILFCGGFVGSGIRYRTTSGDIWRKAPLSIGMWCAAKRER